MPRKDVHYFNERQHLRKCKDCKEDIVVNAEIFVQTTGEEVEFLCINCHPINNSDDIIKPSDESLNILKDDLRKNGYHLPDDNEQLWQEIVILCRKKAAHNAINQHNDYLKKFFDNQEKYNQEIFDDVIKNKLIFHGINFDKDNPWSEETKSILKKKYASGELEVAPTFLWNHINEINMYDLFEKVTFLMASETKFWSRSGL